MAGCRWSLWRVACRERRSARGSQKFRGASRRWGERGERVVGRVRRPGGGRKPITESDPRLVQTLERLIDEQTRGDPESPLRWTCKSTRMIAQELASKKHPVSHVKGGPDSS